MLHPFFTIFTQKLKTLSINIRQLFRRTNKISLRKFISGLIKVSPGQKFRKRSKYDKLEQNGKNFSTYFTDKKIIGLQSKHAGNTSADFIS